MRPTASAILGALLLAGCAMPEPTLQAVPASVDLVPPDYYSRHLVGKRAPKKRPRNARAGTQEDEPSVGEVVDRMQEIEGRLKDLRQRLGK